MDLHGGNIHDRHVELDFSSNVNPFGPPEAVKEYVSSVDYVKSLFVYPRVYPVRLLKALSEYLGFPEDAIVVGPGSSFFIYLLSWLLRSKRVVIPFPTFIEYERAANSSGCEVVHMPLREDMDFRMCLGELTAFSRGADAIFLCNPNNPTGSYMDSEEVRALFRWSEREGVLLILDVAYMFSVGDGTFDFHEIPENVVFLGSFTKPYGIPGVRLAYVYGGRGVIARIKGLIPPWPVGGGVEDIGLICLSSGSFLEESRHLIAEAKRFLKDSLREMGFRVFPSVANYLLVKGSWNPYSFLLERGVLIRRCDNIRGLGPRFFRVSVRPMKECRRLVALLREGYKENPGEHKQA